MSDLLTSLYVPWAQVPTPPEGSSSGVHEAASHADGMVVHDVEAFLNDPKNKALMASTGKPSNNIANNRVTGGEYSEPQPVQLGGPKTTHHVTALYQLCQGRNLVPHFEIEAQADGGFGGWLRVGNQTVSSSEGCPSKKEAKEVLAEKGVELVKGMAVKGKGPNLEGEPKNWVGLLMEYHSAPGSVTGGVGANFIEFAIGSFFACTCTIPGHDAVFGSNTTPFPSKKAARIDAAKEAVQFLIAQGLTNPDGSVKARKKGIPGKAIKADGKALEVKMDATYAQKVNDICPILGLTQPTYRIVPSSPATPHLLSGAAYFGGNPLFPGPVGEVRNVFGKKSAKEECARGVWQVLRGLAKERGVEVEISSGEDEDGDD